MQKSKPINFNPDVWQSIKELAEELATERGRPKEGLADVVAEAITFYRLNRPKPTNNQGVAL